MAGNRRPFSKKLFAGLAVVAGVALLAFETVGPRAMSWSAGERWFWVIVALGLIGLGVAEIRSTSAPPPPPSPLE